MWFHSLLAAWKSALPRRRPVPRLARPRGFRLCLEALEDRSVPSTLNVTSSADTGAVGTLRWAVGVANGSTTRDTIDILTTQPILLTQGELLLSARAGMNIEATAGTATISGGGLSRVFETHGYVNLNGLTITGGKAAGWGGAVLDEGALTVSNCTLSGNSASWAGGAIAVGMGNGNGATLTVSFCTFSDNSAGEYGGAICDYAGTMAGDTLRIAGSTFSGNSASWAGGAIYCATRLLVSGCTFSGNSATASVPCSGGGIYAVNPTNQDSEIDYSSFTGNTPTSLGSGVTTPFFGIGDSGLPPGAVVLPPPIPFG
jgi:predicted outer membrane repeat protein